MNRSTLIAVGAFLVLVVAYFATRESNVSVGVHKLQLKPVGADAIDSIALGTKDGVLLKREGTSWTVASTSNAEKKFPADENTVKALVTALVDLKAEDFVTERTEKHAELELNDEKGFTVRALNRELVLGKSSKNGGAYLRMSGSNEVYVTNGGLGYQARRAMTEWRKKTITTFTADQLVKVTAAPLEGAGFSMTNEGGTWKAASELPKDFRFDAQAAARLGSLLTNLSAQDFSDSETDEVLGLKTPSVLNLEAKDGKKLALSLGSKRPDGKRALRVEGDAQVYFLPAYSGDQLAGNLEQLRDLRVFELEVGKAQKLTLTSAGKKTVAQKDGEAWKVIEPKTLPPGLDLDVTQIPSFLNRLSMQRAQKLAPAGVESKAGLASPSVTVEVALEGGVSKKLVFGAQGETANDVYVKGSDGLLYVGAMGEKTNLEQGVELFKRPPPPPQRGGGGMQGLDQLPPEIRAQIEAQLRQQGQLRQ